MDYFINKSVEPEPNQDVSEIQKAIKQQEYMQNYFEALEELDENGNE